MTRLAQEWRPIPGAPGYEVSDLSAVRSWRRRGGAGFALLDEPHLLRPNPFRGYPRVSVRMELRGRMCSMAVHRLVLLAFVGPRPEGMVVRHIDGDKANNALSNLAYGTYSENEQDKLRHGRNPHARKTHCPQGHPYDEANTIVRRRGRDCRECTVQARRRRTTLARLARAS